MLALMPCQGAELMVVVIADFIFRFLHVIRLVAFNLDQCQKTHVVSARHTFLLIAKIASELINLLLTLIRVVIIDTMLESMKFDF
jgi:hypothetical protein